MSQSKPNAFNEAEAADKNMRLSILNMDDSVEGKVRKASYAGRALIGENLSDPILTPTKNKK